ncbi:hypothetical protein A1332_11830 [Methylomonas methanica]|uniref:Uncharacterized protein n=2 Tax=Methylomonas methanica TaxID=421 RepID=A0A177MKZ8_METMH|nr:hypothetical protein A1332_11830 [Methylomonas methanica]
MDKDREPAIGTKANKAPRDDRSSLEQQLTRQLRYLDNSSALFDKGDHDEANRLATVIRTLLHDTDKSKSLLGQLGLKSTLKFVDTGLYREHLDAAMNEWIQSQHPGMSICAIQPGEAGLVEIGINPDGSAGWRAPLREQRFHPNDPKSSAMLAPQSFEYWWKTPLVEGSDLKRFSRKNLVLIMANQDGGAHVDPSLDRDYANLCSDYLGVQVQFGDPDLTMDANSEIPPVGNNVAFACVRQISFELALTLHRHISRA